MIRRITVIDDDDISLYLSSFVLEDAALAEEILTYSSVEEALEHLQLGGPLVAGPQVLLLDLNMPEQSGWDLLDTLRPYEHELVGSLHVFVLTSSIANSDMRRSAAYPLVSGLLHKPLDEQSLLLIKAKVAAAGFTQTEAAV